MQRSVMTTKSLTDEATEEAMREPGGKARSFRPMWLATNTSSGSIALHVANHNLLLHPMARTGLVGMDHILVDNGSSSRENSSRKWSS